MTLNLLYILNAVSAPLASLFFSFLLFILLLLIEKKERGLSGESIRDIPVVINRIVTSL
jgi:hypothetical protein